MVSNKILPGFRKKNKEKIQLEGFSKISKYECKDLIRQLFKYIGKDNMGRPVLFNILRNALCSKIEDFD